MMADIPETFDNPRRINMELNPKKCSFGFEEEKFLGYMVTSEAITDQPNKQILNKVEASGRLAKYSVELGVYNITYEPRSAIKGQIVLDFTNEVSVGSESMVPLTTPYTVDHQKDCKEEWVLYTDGSSSAKGSAKKMKVQSLPINVDSKLVASQINGSYVACQESMIQYMSKANEYIKCFKNFKIQNIPQNQNQKANVLSKLASVAFNHLTREILVEVLEVPSTEMREINAVVEEEGDNWMTPIIKSLKCPVQKVISNATPSVCRSAACQLCDTRNTHGGMQQAPEASGGSSKIHLTGLLLANYASRCLGGNTKGMDVLGPLPEASRKVKFMILAIDYFTKWIEAKPLAKTTGKELNIQQINTAVAHPQANGLVERANKSLMEGIKTSLGRERKGWVDELPNVLWAFRTSLKTINGETPYSLTFRNEAVISIEIGMPTHQTMTIKEGTLNEEEIKLNLDLLEERREATAIREARYKTKMEQYYNKRVRHTSFKVGEYVYRRNEASRVENLGNLGPKWEGPYLVTESYQNGSYKLETMARREIADPLRWYKLGCNRVKPSSSLTGLELGLKKNNRLELGLIARQAFTIQA
nr:protein NYNRIN-like [Tanacetum cinerariifolium]